MAEKVTQTVEIVGDSRKGVKAYDDLATSAKGAERAVGESADALKGMTRELRSTREGLREVRESQRDAKNAVDAHKDAVELYGASSTQARQATENLRRSVEKSRVETKKTADRVKEMRDRLEQAKRSTDVSETAIRKYERQLKNAERSAKGAAEGQRRLEVSLERASRAMDKATRATAKAGREQAKLKGRLGANLKSLGAGIGKFNGYAAAAAAAAAAVVGTAAAVGRLTNSVAENGDRVAKAAVKYGVGVDEIQRLEFSAERSGASTKNLGVALANLNKDFTNASAGRGRKEFLDALNDIGLSIGDLAGKNAEERLGAIGDALQDVVDPAKRSAAAMGLLGTKAGRELTPLLLQGTKGIRELGDRAEETGRVMSNEAAAAAEAYVDAQTDLKSALQGTGNILAGEIIPLVTDAANGTTEWLIANKEYIRSGFNDALEFGADLWERIENRIALVIPALEAVEAMYVRVTEAFAPLTDLLGEGIDLLGELATSAAGTETPFEAMGAAVALVLKPLEAMVELAALAAEGIADLTGATDRYIAKYGDRLIEEPEDFSNELAGDLRVIPTGSAPQAVSLNPQGARSSTPRRRRGGSRRSVADGSGARGISDDAGIGASADLAIESEKRLTDQMEQEAERRKELLEEETKLREEQAERQAEIAEALAAKEKIATEQRERFVSSLADTTAGALATVVKASIASAEGEEHAMARRVKAFATGIRDQMIVTAAKEGVLALVSAATYDYPGAAQHGAAAGAATAAAIVAGTVAGAISIPESSGGGGGGAGAGTAASAGGGASASIGESQAPVSVGRDERRATVASNSSAPTVVITGNTFVGADEATADRLREMIQQSLRRAA